MNEYNYQMTRSTANAAPAHHAIAEAKYDDDIGNSFGGIVVYFLLTSTAEKHDQKRVDTMLEQLTEYVGSDCNRAMDVSFTHAFCQKFLASSVTEDMSAQIVWTAPNGSRLASRQRSGKLCVTTMLAK